MLRTPPHPTRSCRPSRTWRSPRIVAAPATPLPTDAWIGKWVGVEGLVLEIAPGPDAGQYALKVTLLDGPANYVGTRIGRDDPPLTRDGKEETIRKAAGDETGLKYLGGEEELSRSSSRARASAGIDGATVTIRR